jgi:hypothetical protein
MMFFGSLLLLILEFFLSRSAFDLLFLSFIVLLVLWSLVYSWYYFRTHGTTRESA